MDRKKELLDKIWTTTKVRILAEERLLQNDKIAHFATIWYSFLLVVWTLFQEPIRLYVVYANEVNIAFSVLLMIVSVTLYGLKFGQQSEYFKNCYHQLQRLGAMVKDADPKDLKELDLEYVSILEGAPNHSSNDYRKLLVSRWCQGDPLISAGTDKQRKPTFAELATYYAQLLWRWLFIFLVFFAPIVAAATILWLKK